MGRKDSDTTQRLNNNNYYSRDYHYKAIKVKKNQNISSSIIKYSKTDNVLKDICSIINSARDYAFQSVNIALVERNWLIGYRIAEEELKGEGRADYGTEIIKKLSTEDSGKDVQKHIKYITYNAHENRLDKQ